MRHAGVRPSLRPGQGFYGSSLIGIRGKARRVGKGGPQRRRSVMPPFCLCLRCGERSTDMIFAGAREARIELNGLHQYDVDSIVCILHSYLFRLYYNPGSRTGIAQPLNENLMGSGVELVWTFHAPATGAKAPVSPSTKPQETGAAPTGAARPGPRCSQPASRASATRPGEAGASALGRIS